MSHQNTPPLYDRIINCVAVPNPQEDDIALRADIVEDQVISFGGDRVELENHGLFIFNAMLIMRHMRKNGVQDSYLRDIPGGPSFLPEASHDHRQSMFNIEIGKLVRSFAEQTDSSLVIEQTGMRDSARTGLHQGLYLADMRTVPPKAWSFDVKAFKAIDDKKPKKPNNAPLHPALMKREPTGQVDYRSTRWVPFTKHQTEGVPVRAEPESSVRTAEQSTKQLAFTIVFENELYDLKISKRSFARLNPKIRMILAYSQVAGKQLNPQRLLDHLQDTINIGTTEGARLSRPSIIAKHKECIMRDGYISINEDTDVLALTDKAHDALLGAVVSSKDARPVPATKQTSPHLPAAMLRPRVSQQLTTALRLAKKYGDEAEVKTYEQLIERTQSGDVSFETMQTLHTYLDLKVAQLVRTEQKERVRARLRRDANIPWY